MKWIYFNDEFLEEEKGLFHYSDLAIQRGYGVFDFLRLIDNIPLFVADHIKRLQASSKEMALVLTYSNEDLQQIVTELIERNNIPNSGIRITVTGGYSADSYTVVKPNLLISQHQYKLPSADQLEKGIKLVSYQHQRQIPHVKTIDYLMAIRLQPFVRQNHADDLLYYYNDRVTECPRSNFFIVTNDDKIITPANNILIGISRSKLLQIAAKEFDVEERDISLDEVKSANEAFITSTTKAILPVYQLDEYVFPAKKITRKLQKLFSDAVKESLPQNIQNC